MDVSKLPTAAFGSASAMWWGTLGFIAIETSGFGLAVASYLYLAQNAQEWPLAAPPPNSTAGNAPHARASRFAYSEPSG